MHDLNYAALTAWANERVPDAAFWSVSGAHLYGFPSVDSDIDLRGSYFAPIPALIGLRIPSETQEPKGWLGGVEVEAVAHEAGKYLRLMLKHNGYILEQVFSPLVVHGAEFLARLRPLAARCVTRGCYYHYRGFLHTQRKQIDGQNGVKAKALLYAYRVVLTGIHLLRTGEVESHLPTLNASFRLGFIPELIERKTHAEFGTLADLDAVLHTAELDRLEAELDRAFAESTLPEAGPVDEVNRFLVAERVARS